MVEIADRAHNDVVILRQPQLIIFHSSFPSLNTMTPETPTSTPQPRKADRILNILLIVAIIACVLVVALRVFFFEKIEVRKTSMSPTFNDKDTVWINKIAAVRRGDVAVFFDHLEASASDEADSSRRLIKRVVALAGDQVYADENADGSYSLYIIYAGDSAPTAEQYTFRGDPVAIPNFSYNHSLFSFILNHVGRDNAYTLPEGTFFAVGDNRPVSLDSRNYGAVPLEQIIGVVM
jgi:signal peptidase I